MGWTNSHLYSFMIGGEEFSLKEYELDIEYQDSKKCGLGEFKEDKFDYVYDFGDYWEHQIEIVQKLRGKGPTAALCVDGRGKDLILLPYFGNYFCEGYLLLQK